MMSIQLVAAVADVVPDRDYSRTELYLGGGWIISGFIILALLQVTTIVFLVVFYHRLMANKHAAVQPQDKTSVVNRDDARPT